MLSRMHIILACGTDTGPMLHRLKHGMLHRLKCGMLWVTYMDASL